MSVYAIAPAPGARRPTPKEVLEAFKQTAAFFKRSSKLPKDPAKGTWRASTRGLVVDVDGESFTVQKNAGSDGLIIRMFALNIANIAGAQIVTDDSGTEWQLTPATKPAKKRKRT